MSNIKDQVAAFLYATGLVNDSEDIVDLQFGKFQNGTVPLKIGIKPQKEVQLIENG